MNKTPPEHADEALRQALHAALAGDTRSTALQERVLAQWRQRYPGLASEARLATTAGGPGWRLAQHPGRWLGAAALASALALLAWCARPDPALDELMQLDVLSQIAIGEM